MLSLRERIHHRNQTHHRFEELFRNLTRVRRAASLLQHHDAITG